MSDLEFRPTTEADWRQRITTDLKGRDADEVLLWQGDAGILLDAVSTRDSGYRFPDQSFPPELKWEILEQIDEAGQNDIVTIDIRPSIQVAGSLSNQCAIAAAELAERLRSAEPVREVRAVVPVGTRIFLEIGKLRALRQMLCDVRPASDGSTPGDAGSPAAAASAGDGVKLWAVAAGSCECPDRQTHQIRLTFACIAAVLGGVDGVLPTPYDSSDVSIRLARNVLLIMRHESGLEGISTISNGSYYVDQVSRKVYDAARRTLGEIRTAGGLSAAVREGRLASILSSARSRTAEVDPRP